MKDVLREYGRTVALFSAAGLVLSLLVGLLARNPFGVMLLRALLFAVLFGGVGAGLRFIVRRFLPELVAGEAAGAAAADDASVRPEGSTIDIVLPEEPPPVEGARQGQGEILEELPGTGDAGGAIAVEEIDAAEPAAAPPPRHRSAEPRVFHEGLDALPDIAPLGEGGVAARRAGARAKPSDAAHGVLEREDPASLARAVRTVLKREERS